RLADGQDDARVGSAAADVAFHRPGDVLGCGVRVLAEQRGAGHDHAGCAVAALHRPDLQKGFLQRVELAVSLQALDGGDLLARASLNAGDAGPGGLAVDEHRAGAAAALAAAVLAPGQVQVVPQDAEQAPPGVGLDAPPRPVYLQLVDA